MLIPIIVSVCLFLFIFYSPPVVGLLLIVAREVEFLFFKLKKSPPPVPLGHQTYGSFLFIINLLGDVNVLLRIEASCVSPVVWSFDIQK